jgi:ferredoxin-NADP reductase
VQLTRPIREVLPVTPRARIVRIDLGDESFPYRAGQALLVGSHGSHQRRPYSIADSPECAERDRCLELLVGVEPDGRAGPHLTMVPGELVDVDGPVGRFTFPEHPAERRFLFIAGGTGIAPLRAMLRHALGVPHDEIGLLFSARTPGELAYEPEFRALADAGRIELQLRVTREVAPDVWGGTRGRLSNADLAPLVHDVKTLCFVCGPPALVREIPRALEALGVPRKRIRTEEWMDRD